MEDLEELRRLMEKATKKKLPSLHNGRDLSDLGLESLDRIAIIIAVEERFGIELSEQAASAIRTVDDLLRFIREKT